MNEHEEIPLSELTELLPKMEGKAEIKAKKYGPGFINMAIPDRGHAPSLRAVEFSSAADFNHWAQENDAQGYVIAYLGIRAGNIFALYGTVLDEFTREEMRVAAEYTRQKLEEFRRAQAAAKEQEEIAANAAGAEKDALVAHGKFCVAAHGTVVAELRDASKLKANRKSLADDIVKLLTEAGVGMDKVSKLLKQYVKDGVA